LQIILIQKLSIFQKHHNFELFQLVSVCTAKYKFPLCARARVNICLLTLQARRENSFLNVKVIHMHPSASSRRNRKGMSQTVQVRKFHALFSTVKFIRHSGRRFASAAREILHIEWRPARHRCRVAGAKRRERKGGGGGRKGHPAGHI